MIKGTFPIEKFRELETPFYYYDMKVLRDTLDTIKKEVSKYENFHVHYAIKANANPKVLKRIQAAGLGVDCVSGGEIQAALDAGAEYAGGEELAQKIQSENWFDFDVVVATPDMMGVVGRLGKVLGPKGLMPSPKAGTVTMDVTKAVNEIKSGKIEYRLDKTNIIHVPVGKASFTEEQLSDNFQSLMGAINKAKPASLKGQYIKSATLTSTMGPGVKLNVVKITQ